MRAMSKRFPEPDMQPMHPTYAMMRTLMRVMKPCSSGSGLKYRSTLGLNVCTARPTWSSSGDSLEIFSQGMVHSTRSPEAFLAEPAVPRSARAIG